MAILEYCCLFQCFGWVFVNLTQTYICLGRENFNWEKRLRKTSLWVNVFDIFLGNDWCGKSHFIVVCCICALCGVVWCVVYVYMCMTCSMLYLYTCMVCCVLYVYMCVISCVSYVYRCGMLYVYICVVWCVLCVVFWYVLLPGYECVVCWHTCGHMCVHPCGDLKLTLSLFVHCFFFFFEEGLLLNQMLANAKWSY